MPAAAMRAWQTPLIVLVCGTLICLISLGARNTYGLLLGPVSSDLGWGREVFSLAMAMQAMVWGVATPFAGAIADKYGPGRVLAAGGIGFALGLYLMSVASAPWESMLSIGFLTGMAMAATTFPIVLAVVGRVAPEKHRSLYLGIASAGGSSGQLLVVPGAQWAIDAWGWPVMLVALAGLCALMTPLAAGLAGGQNTGGAGTQSFSDAIAEASRHGGFLLLTAGYFVCGFQIQFISSHLPALLSDNGISAWWAATAIAVIGLANMAGCFLWGWLGGRYRSKYLLCVLYLARSIIMALFFALPITTASLIAFSIGIGIVWLATVPLTTNVVGRIFGLQYLATLFGFTFFSHQIGSFVGIWLGGIVYDATGSYAAIWWIAVALGLIAALVNYPIDDRPVARITVARP